MSDLLGLKEYLPYIKLAAIGGGVALVFITIAAFTYIAHTTCRPLFVVLQWMVGYTPGQPGEVAQGFSYGARMSFWAALIGLAVWFFFH